MTEKWQEYSAEGFHYIEMPKGIRLWYSKNIKYATVEYDLYPAGYQLSQKGEDEVWQLYKEVANKKSEITTSKPTATLRIPKEHLEKVILKLMKILPNNLEKDPNIKKYTDKG